MLATYAELNPHGSGRVTREEWVNLLWGVAQRLAFPLSTEQLVTLFDVADSHARVGHVDLNEVLASPATAAPSTLHLPTSTSTAQSPRRSSR